MKIAGIVCLVFAVLNFIVFLIASSQGDQKGAARSINGMITIGFIGGLLIYFANKKKKEKEDKDKWNKS